MHWTAEETCEKPGKISLDNGIYDCPYCLCSTNCLSCIEPLSDGFYGLRCQDVNSKVFNEAQGAEAGKIQGCVGVGRGV